MSKPIDPALIADILKDGRAARIPAQARDDAPRASDGIWIILGAAAAFGWIAGLAWFGVFG